MHIREETVGKIAELAKLSLDNNQIKKAMQEIGEILEYVSVLNKLDTDDVLPFSEFNGCINVMREDEVLPSQSREDMLKNAKCKGTDTVIVPKTVE